MASTTLRQEDLKVLDQTRQRLFQLSVNIASLKADVQRGNPLPPWAAIQASASILGQNMNGLVEHLAKHSDTLNSSVVYPSTNYPGRTQEGLLGQLLRKKYEPQVETWVDEGRAMQSGSKEGKEEDVEDLWNWAAEWIGPRVAKYVGEDSRDHYTFEEQEAGIENVRTGLRRTLDEEDSEEDDDGDDDDEEMEDITLEGTAASAPSTSNVGKADGGARVKKTKLADILRLAGSGVVLDQ